MLAHSEPLRMRTDRNEGITDHTDLLTDRAKTAATHNSQRSLFGRYTKNPSGNEL